MAVNLSQPDPKTIFPVPGVTLGVAGANIRKPDRKDLLVITLDDGARVAGVFTQNRFCAAPVIVARQHLSMLDPDASIRALMINTGCANAGTGKEGIAAARQTCGELARLLGCSSAQVLPFSTGVIMEPLPVGRITAGLPACMPLPAVDILADASSASPFRALMLVPFAADGVDEALALSLAIQRAVTELRGPGLAVDEHALEAVFAAIERSGFVPAEEVGVAVDVGASRLYRDGRYQCGATDYDADGWSERLVRLVDEYPVASLEDPFAETGELVRFTPLVDERARVVGNQLFASDAERIAAAASDGLASGVCLRPEAAGTLSELRMAFDAARLAAWPVFFTGDAAVEDTSLVHVATAWQSSYIKLGGVGRGSLARWNELIRIEAELRPSPSLLHIETAARLVH